MRTIYLSILYCLFAVFQMSAQKLTLTVNLTDTRTSEPLIGATVRVADKGAVSNIDGKCQFELDAGQYEINVSFLGFDTQKERVDLSGNTTISIALNETENLLQQTTVTAGRYEKPLSKVTVSLDVIKPAFLENTNSLSLDNALDRVPGVNVIDGQPNIRGGSGFSYGAGSRVLILMDDLPALQADAGFPNWNDFPVENISQIEIVKGAASALYGSSALNGIINLRTGFAKDKPETQISLFSGVTGHPADDAMRWWGRDSSELGLPHETGASFAHRRKIGKWDLVVGAYGLTADSYQRSSFRKYARLTPNVRYRVNDRWTAGLNANITFGKSASFFIWGGDSTLAFQPGSDAIQTSRGRTRNTIDPYVQYLDKYGNRHKLLNRYYFIRNRSTANQSNSSDSWYSEYQFHRVFQSSGLSLTAGAVGNIVAVTAELYGDTSYTIKTGAFYAQLEKEFFERLNLSIGARYEANVLLSPELVRGVAIPNGKAKEAKPVLRFGANYRLGRATYLRSSWGQGYRYPTIAEKFVATNFGVGNSVEANPTLVSETGWSAEIAIKQGIKLGKWKGFIDIAAFESRYFDMMEFVVDRITFVPPATFATIFQSKNVGDTRIKGIEFGVQGIGAVAGNQLTVNAGYTYIDPKYVVFDDYEKANTSDTSQNILKYRFKHTFKADIDYQLGRFRLGTNINYFSFMEAIDAVFDLGLPGVHQFRENHRQGTFLLDARLGYQVTDQLQVLFIGKNLLKQEYQTRPALMGQPINYALRLDWKF
jgi:outer membrane cobalamin receptor